jgi:hypothetical protein
MTLVEFSQDFDDLLAALNDARAEFVIVGAHALAIHGYVRATGDLDVHVRPTRGNAQRVVEALVAFGAPVAAHSITAADFEVPGMIYQIGLPPNRIDLLTQLSGVDFDECLDGSVAGTLGTQQVRFIGLRAQIKNKLASARKKDLADVEILEALLLQQGR